MWRPMGQITSAIFGWTLLRGSSRRFSNLLYYFTAPVYISRTMRMLKSGSECRSAWQLRNKRYCESGVNLWVFPFSKHVYNELVDGILDRLCLAGLVSRHPGFYLLGGGGGRKLPPDVSASPKKVSPLKKIKSYFKYWPYLTTILRNQWRLQMSRNAISANPKHYFSKFFRGSMPPEPPRRSKKLFLPLRGSKIF